MKGHRMPDACPFGNLYKAVNEIFKIFLTA